MEESTNNNNVQSVCAAFVPSQQPSENKGDLNARKGGFLANVNLPNGATIKSVAM